MAIPLAAVSAISKGAQAVAGIGKTIASAVDAGDKQAEARKMSEMERNREEEALDRRYRREDASAARSGEEIMIERGERAAAKQVAEQERGYRRGQNALDRTLSMLNNNPNLRARTLSIFRR